MGDLSRHFSRHEFRCTGCRGRVCPHGYNGGRGMDTVDAALLRILDTVRDYFGRPVHVNSGFRCVQRNAEVGGASASQHLQGRAADIVVSGVPPSKVYAFLDTWHDGGLGNYPTFTHVDTRNKRERF